MRAGGKGYRVVGQLKDTDRIMEGSFWVGVYPGMTEAMIDDMSEVIRSAVSGTVL